MADVFEGPIDAEDVGGPRLLEPDGCRVVPGSLLDGSSGAGVGKTRSGLVVRVV